MTPLYAIFTGAILGYAIRLRYLLSRERSRSRRWREMLQDERTRARDMRRECDCLKKQRVELCRRMRARDRESVN